MNKINARRLLISIEAGAERVHTGGCCYTIYRKDYTLENGAIADEPVAVSYSGISKSEFMQSYIESIASGGINKK